MLYAPIQAVIAHTVLYNTTTGSEEITRILHGRQDPTLIKCFNAINS